MTEICTVVESERLKLYPLSDEKMKMIIEAENDPEMKAAYSEMLQGCIDDPENRIWYAVWSIELKDRQGTVVGDFCFKGINTDGTVEIGYGLYEGYCGHGYMTEAVKKISEWALNQKGITGVQAETSPDNTASQKVLQNSGYVADGTFGEEGPLFFYKGNDR